MDIEFHDKYKIKISRKLTVNPRLQVGDYPTRISREYTENINDTHRVGDKNMLGGTNICARI